MAQDLSIETPAERAENPIRADSSEAVTLGEGLVMKSRLLMKK